MVSKKTCEPKALSMRFSRSSTVTYLQQFEGTRCALLCTLMLVGIHTSAATTDAAPDFISYQGTAFLASDGVTPVTGAADVQFRLYTSETAPLEDAVWAEVHEDTPFFNGVFNVYLGGGETISGVPKPALADAFKSAPLWLGIKIGLDAEMTSRQRITSVPYALTATHVETAIHGVPAGTMVMFAGATPPPGWVLCDGRSLNSLTNPEYAGLWNVIQTMWGGSGESSFNVPDLRAQTVIGSGAGIDQNTDTAFGNSAGLQSPVRTAGTRFGAEADVVTPEQMPSHTHGYSDYYLTNQYPTKHTGGLGLAASTPTDNPKTTGSTGGGTAHNNVQPSIYLNFIIKL